SRYPTVHGAPVHVGDPEELGIGDLGAPDYGDRVEIRDGEIPVFWACGVTPQAVAAASRPELMITHAPGHMFVTDVPDAAQATLQASAIGRTGEPVPPRTFSGRQTNANSRTPSRASSSR